MSLFGFLRSALLLVILAGAFVLAARGEPTPATTPPVSYFDMEALIGEQPGGASFATFLQEVDGVTYEKDGKGNPILPVFRMSDAKPTTTDSGHFYPPHRDDGPVWKARPTTSEGGFSVFNH